LYLDLLRVFAMVSVCVIHVSTAFLLQNPIGSVNWTVQYCFSSSTKYAVPLFVMISGALWLSREKIDVRKLYGGNILKIGVAFLFWSFAYALVCEIIFPLLGGAALNADVFRSFFHQLLVGRYHLWYCFMIAGLYAALPILKRISEDDALLNYFLILSFVTSMVWTGVRSLDSSGISAEIIDNTHLYLGLGYTFYFVFGYWMSRKTLSRGQCAAIYGLGILATVYKVACGIALSRGRQTLVSIVFFDELAVCLQACALFLLFKELAGWIKYGNSRSARLTAVSNACFGIYLSHDFFKWIIVNYLFKGTEISAIIITPAVVLMVFTFSFCVAALLKKLPGLGEFVV
jgi:surface polysaccharide O-acyltransferase-like enzyme